MNETRYIFRMDDITPTMDWDRFWSALNLLNRHRVKPLLGIVPQNGDPNLNCREPHPQFWDTMRTLGRRGLVDFAQHGYQHTLSPKPGRALLKATHGTTVDRSEFAGYSYPEQLSRITKGRDILLEQGIDTTYFFAPNHSFDNTTLRALRTAGFTAVSDGIALYPFKSFGLTFIPQQLWTPRRMLTGVFTICLHTNEIRPSNLTTIRQFLRMPITCSSFQAEVDTFKSSPLRKVCNPLFKHAYSGMRTLKRTVSRYRETSPQSDFPHTLSPSSEGGPSNMHE